MTWSCPRDENGWRVPRRDTAAREIYQMMCGGRKRAEIAAQLGRPPHVVSVVMHQIKHPDRECARYRADVERRRVKRNANNPDYKPRQPHSQYARKLARILHVTLHEADRLEAEVNHESPA